MSNSIAHDEQQLIEQHLVEEGRVRERSRLAGREWWVEVAVALAFAVSAGVLAATFGGAQSVSVPLALTYVALFAIVSQINFDVGAGYTDPTTLLLVPMLFALPAALVPVLVAAALVLKRLSYAVRRKRHLARSLLALGDAWQALGPALVFAVAGVVEPSWNDWPIYLAALGAYLIVDGSVSAFSERVGLGVPIRSQLRPALWVYLVDLLLAPVGLLVAFVAAGAPAAVLGILPLFGLIAIFAGERAVRIDQSIELGHAYRGTALLLGDVVEADDAYTGAHSRDVVDLSVAVADALGLLEVERRNVELAAMLHDVGKIAVPDEIINKAGPLDEEEWAVMKRHTIEGQRMLDSIGGMLSEVGRVVRASHEHYDGGGYPDGISGESIPIEARICSCCDAFSAMTTDRSYRPAMALTDAFAELRACAGSQFDPLVVDVLISVVTSAQFALTTGPCLTGRSPDPALSSV